MKRYIIGVDGGGTKTLAVTFDLEGNEVIRKTSGFGNFSVDDSLTINHLNDVLNQITKEIPNDEIQEIVIGIAGYSNFSSKKELLSILKSTFGTTVKMVTDAEIALYSVKQERLQNVIMVLGGTGSVVMVEDKGKIRFIGGFGHLLGDEGSGYHLAITALKNIIDQYENGLEITPLTKAILKQINASDYTEIKAFVYNNKKSEIAKLSHFIAEYAINGDVEAISLFKEEGKLLAEQTIKAYRSLKSNDEVLVGIKGGFLLNAPYVKETLMEELNRSDMKYKMDDTLLEPVWGAYYLAKHHLRKR